MKTISKVLLVGASLALAALMPREATAQQTTGLQSFQITNVLTGASSVSNTTGFPLTANVGTGTAIGIQNYDSLLIDVQGFLVNTNATASQLQITHCFSGTQNVPTVATNTNIWSAGTIITNQNDFFTNNPVIDSVPLPGATTNFFHWATNLPSTSIAGNATYIGIFGMSNNFTSGNCFLTNAVVSVGKKPKVVKFP
jgi:hypothetical protein